MGPVIPLKISLHCRIRLPSYSECQRGSDRPKQRELQVKRFGEEEGKARPTISDMEPYAGLDMAKKRLGLQISHPSLNRSRNIQKYYGNVVVSADLSICSYSPWRQSDKNTTSQLNSEVTTHWDRGGGSITPPKMKRDIFGGNEQKAPGGGKLACATCCNDIADNSDATLVKTPFC